jgi:hypothetical protein
MWTGSLAPTIGPRLQKAVASNGATNEVIALAGSCARLETFRRR